jgi:hypothetical protein
MDTVIGTFFAFAFFFGALAVVVWALYEMSPFRVSTGSWPTPSDDGRE